MNKDLHDSELQMASHDGEAICSFGRMFWSMLFRSEQNVVQYTVFAINILHKSIFMLYYSHANHHRHPRRDLSDRQNPRGATGGHASNVGFGRVGSGDKGQSNASETV